MYPTAAIPIPRWPVVGCTEGLHIVIAQCWLERDERTDRDEFLNGESKVKKGKAWSRYNIKVIPLSISKILDAKSRKGCNL